ncbi:MAG: 2-C-methyl-D-erythritol 4-phosphate cytidylyltransferase [Tissierellia bacterium]|nr:2-C-methyl-D-erythritol 4-phosphate cytidylyltransferase [Tissierellia bacterium]
MISGNKVCVLIAAAGMSHRMKSAINKTFLEIDGKTVLAHSIEKFEKCPYVDEILVLARAEELEYVREHIVGRGNYQKVTKVVAGGMTRQESIKKGLAQVSSSMDILLTHDGARPFVHVETINRALESVLLKRACVVGVPVKDTIKTVWDDGSTIVHLTPKRSLLWAAQSPQVFFAKDLHDAYAHALKEGIEATDDSSLVEKIGIEVHMVSGTYDNIKITTPEDMILAELFNEYQKKEEKRRVFCV